MNIEHVKLVIDKIESDPTCWDQTKWHCGTTHCFFGLAQVLSGKDPDKNTVERDAEIFLDMGPVDARYFAAAHRTLADLKTAFDPAYNQAGYDRDGYARDGYDREGYDRDGYDREWV